MSSTVLYDALGPQGRRTVAIGSVVGGLVVLALVAVVGLRLAEQGEFEAELWQPFADNRDLQRLIWQGLLGTLAAAVVAMLLSMVLGAVLAAGRLSLSRAVRWPAGALVEFFRGTPVLLLILFAFLGLPSLGVDLRAFWYVVIGLTAYNMAVLCEIFRAGVLSLDRGQSEAAYAVGLTRGQTLRIVLLPQAVRRMLPALISQLVTILKDTSLGFVVAYGELLRQGGLIVQNLDNPIQTYTVIAAIYIAINYSLSRFARWLEARQSRRYGRAAAAGVTEELAVLQADRPAPVKV